MAGCSLTLPWVMQTANTGKVPPPAHMCPHMRAHVGQPGAHWLAVCPYRCDEWCWVVLLFACLNGGAEVHTPPLATPTLASTFECTPPYPHRLLRTMFQPSHVLRHGVRGPPASLFNLIHVINE